MTQGKVAIGCCHGKQCDALRGGHEEGIGTAIASIPRFNYSCARNLTSEHVGRGQIRSKIGWRASGAHVRGKRRADFRRATRIVFIKPPPLPLARNRTCDRAPPRDVFFARGTPRRRRRNLVFRSQNFPKEPLGPRAGRGSTTRAVDPLVKGQEIRTRGERTRLTLSSRSA